MSKRIARALSTNITLYSVCLVIFIVATIPFKPLLAAGEGVLAIGLFIYSRRKGHLMQQRMRQYMERMAGGMDSAARSNMLFAPMPMMVFDVNTEEVLWSNEEFLRLTNQHEQIFESRLSTVVPGFSKRWLVEGKSECPDEFRWNDHIYRVYGCLSRPEDVNNGQNLLATTYWMDVTENREMHDRLQKTHPVVAILVLDNYEELMKACPETKRSAVLARLEEKLGKWTADSDGLLLSYDRDRYLYVFSEKDYQHYADEKFSILESVREVVAGEGVAATLSIGIRAGSGPP